MLGRIKYIVPDAVHEFKGGVEISETEMYPFNKTNWIDQDLTISDITVGAEVEFELGAPNRLNKRYPKQMRFAGQEITAPAQPFVFQTKHSMGDFKKFVYIRTAELLPDLCEMVEGFAQTEENSPAGLYRKIAHAYIALEDADFVWLRPEQDAVLIPLGYQTRSGDPIYLYCVPNTEADKSTWYCSKLYCAGHVVGGAALFNEVFNANWYDLEADLKQLGVIVPEDVKEIVKMVERRCTAPEESLIWLENGVLSDEEHADHLYVPTGYFEKGGKEIYMLCTRQKGVRGYGWYYDCLTYENAPLDVYDKKNWLELWAQLEWKDVFAGVIDKTLEEKWSFKNRNDNGILKNYLIYTFAHQWRVGEVCTSADERFAAFNTGLPERNTFKYLYAFFEKIDADVTNKHPLYFAPKYRLRGFVLQDRGGDGKELTTQFRPLPNPPKYFTARSATVWELDFNDSNHAAVPGFDDMHILIQRCERLPLDFFRYPAFRSERLRNILDSQADTAQKYREIREYFSPIVGGEPDEEVTQVYRMLHGALEQVINDAVKRLSWNWRAVVPCYSPEHEETCFLLPVRFCDPAKADRALIASAHTVEDKTVYTIHTVIPLDWAYLDARLVCRPESEWLAAEYIG